MSETLRSILVTGGAGFIGSNFIRFLLVRHPELRVVNLDKLTYAGNLENLRDLEGDMRLTFVRGDICSRAVVEEVVRSHRVEAIVNFAAESHVDRSILGAAVFVETNVVGTQVLLDVARDLKVRRFLQVSTDEVYGSLGPEGAFTETTPLQPNSPYAASKASADLLVRAYHHTFGLPAVITRCSNNYGPFQFPEKLIPLMVINALGDRPLPVYGDGGQVRDWLHVEDHSAALDLVLRRAEPGSIYNIGGNNEWRNVDLVQLILRTLGKPDSLIRFVADRPGHDRRYAIDASKIRADLGWEPVRRFDEGLVETIRWYQSHADWWQSILSGEYQDYYKTQYANR